MTNWLTTRSKWKPTTLVLTALFISYAAFAVTPERERHGMPLKILQDPNAFAGIQPELIPKGGWPPLWIDARAIALTPEGKLDLEQAAPMSPPAKWKEVFERYKPGQYGPQGSMRAAREAQEARGCHPIGEFYVSEVLPPDRGSLEHTIETAETIVLGSVLQKSYGFYRGVPGQLIEIAPLRTFGLGPRSKRGAFFFFMPVGEFQIGNERICKSDMRYGTPPEVGEEVFVFARPPAGENHDVLDIHDPGEVISIRADGTASMPGKSVAQPEIGAPSRELELRTKAQILNALEKRADR